MKIALLGYGKMGKIIEKIAQERDHEICLRLTSENREALTTLKSSNADVAIDFSTPEAAADNLKACFAQGVPVVCGTTGWLKAWDDVILQMTENKGTLLYASNFSIGVNLFFQLNEKLAQIMHPHAKAYQPTIEEVHHVHKKDAPSGTAISLAEGIIKHWPDKTSWTLTGEKKSEKQLAINAVRKDEVPGTHSIEYKSNIDSIIIQHVAYSREGFALGAVLTAEWLPRQKGLKTMAEFLR